MEKTEISKETILYPMPCSIVGATVHGKPNYLTVAWFSMVNQKPPYLAIAIGKTRYTNSGIKDNKTFSINIPSMEMLDLTDYCGIVSGKKYNKAERFQTFYGPGKTAPMIKECPYNIECALVQTVDLPSHDLFIGEISAVYSDDRYLTNGIPDMSKIDPLILSMPESSYLAIGRYVGEAWDAGKKLVKR